MKLRKGMMIEVLELELTNPTGGLIDRGGMRDQLDPITRDKQTQSRRIREGVQTTIEEKETRG